nr:uncharacterized protein LOC117990816 [Maniola hyperantus]
MNFSNYLMLCLCSLIQNSNEVIYFVRSIEAIGISYYKISFRLGTCQENLLFSEHKAWPIARMNRILDIYYKSEISELTVSSVEIKLVINNTDCVGTSKRGVGFQEFSATIFLSTNMAAIFYSLRIYTCSRTFEIDLVVEDEHLNLPLTPGEENEDED